MVCGVAGWVGVFYEQECLGVFSVASDVLLVSCAPFPSNLDRGPSSLNNAPPLPFLYWQN